MVGDENSRGGRGSGPHISANKQVLVEGFDEIPVFQALVDKLAIEVDNIQTYKGHPQLGPFLKTLVSLADFSSVNSLAIVGDAEFNPGSTQDRTRDTSRFVGLTGTDRTMDAFLTGKPQGRLSRHSALGEAAAAGFWDFDSDVYSDVFDPFRTLLHAL